MTIRGDYYISVRAAREHCGLHNIDPTEDAVERATKAIADAASDATLVREQDNGLFLYRTKHRFGRFQFLVSRARRDEGARHQIVSVLPASPYAKLERRHNRNRGAPRDKEMRDHVVAIRDFDWATIESLALAREVTPSKLIAILAREEKARTQREEENAGTSSAPATPPRRRRVIVEPK